MRGVIYGFNRRMQQAVEGTTGEVRWQTRSLARGLLIAAGDKPVGSSSL